MNAIPLIKRKLVPPRMPEPYVHRPKLHAGLARGLEPSKRLSMVCGGPGYGKSTLAAAYLRDLDVPASWYSLDESDTDLGTFLTYLHGALKLAVPGLSDRAMELVRSAPNLDAVLQTVIGLLAEELAEGAEEGAVLVLDDFHAVGKVPGILKAVEYLAQYLPDNWQLLLTTREQPQLPLPQMRVRQQLVEVGVKELRFSATELRELLLKLSGVTLTDAEAVELLGHTDGWVASVILAAQAVKGAGGDARDLLFRELDHPAALYDYLAQEVFSLQPEPMQAFLLETSLLPHVDANTCREALDVEDAADRIRHLIQGNLLFPEDQDARDPAASAATAGYVYHPSFRRFLQSRLEESVGTAEIQTLSRKLGAHLAEHDPEDALGLLLRGQALPEAEALVVRLAEDLIAHNQLERLRGLLERFPVDYRAGSYAMCHYQGEVFRLWGDYDQAIGLFQRAAELAANDAQKGRARVHLAAIYMFRNDSRANEILQEGEGLLAAEDLATRAFAHNLRGAWAFGTHQGQAAMASYEQALACYRQIGDPIGQAKVLNNLGLCYTRFGQFESAIATCQEAVAQSELAGRVPLPMTFNNLAAVYTYQGRFQEAWAAAERAMDLAQLLRSRRDMLYAQIALGAAALGLGDLRRAEGHFDAARDGALNLQDKTTAAKAIGALAEVALRQGAWPRARALADQALELAAMPLDDPRMIDLAILRGATLVDTGAADEARVLLDRLAEEFKALGFRYRQTQIAFYRARLAAREGDAAAQARLWDEAATLADAYEFHFLKEDEGSRMGVPAAPVVRDEQPAAVEIRTVAGAPATPGEPARPGVVPAITIQAFGELKVWVGDRMVASREWRGFKTKMILAYLLGHPDGVSKEALTDLLYGEMDTTRTAILVLISRLRHALEPDLDKQTPSRFVHFVDGRYTFNFALPFQLDTQDFEYHLKLGADAALGLEDRRRHWKSALATYDGPYLAELTADGPWLTIERERFHRLAQEAHTALVRSYLDAKDDHGALEAAEANLAFDSCCEFAHQVKMGCLARLGQREQALRHYQIMKQVFERELGGPPSAASEALFQTISQGREVVLPEVLR